MKIKHLLYSFFCIMLVITSARAETEKKELIFSIEIIATAHQIEPIKEQENKNSQSGIFFYRVISEDSMDTIHGYRYLRGESEMIYGEGSYRSQQLEEALNKIEFKNFPYRERVEAIKRSDAPTIPVITCDGAKYRITINFDGESFVLEEWNPAPEIDYYSKYDSDIKKLKSFIDEISLSYGRLKLGI